MYGPFLNMTIGCTNTAKRDANHILISQVVDLSVISYLYQYDNSFWYRYESTDHLWNQKII